jgi:transcriptional regulator with XRE-family HTH domain
MSFGQLIRKHREKKGLSQTELGHMLGYTTGQFISNLERDITPVPAKIIGRISDLLDIAKDALVKEALKQHRQSFEKSVERFKGKLGA